MHLSIIIPAFNEAKRITETLSRIESYLKKQDYLYEIIIVDDGSNDSTADLVRNRSTHNNAIRLLQNKKNMGKGYSVKRGMLEAQGEYLLFSDADLSIPTEEIEKLIPWFSKGYDIVIGSRRLRASNIVRHQPFYRVGIGRVFNILTQFLIVKGIKDTQCGFKCFRRDVAKQVFQRQTVNGFCFDVEILFIAAQLGYRVKEVPITWYDSKGTTVNILIDPLKMFLDLLKIRLNFILKREKK
jgi:dolichyl-phosphate beta-glucosyltransferase